MLSLHSRLWSHPPQQAEYTLSFLNLRLIQTKIKTFITLFAKCKHIYGLKIMKSEFKTLRTGGTLQLTEIRQTRSNWRKSVVATENFNPCISLSLSLYVYVYVYVYIYIYIGMHNIGFCRYFSAHFGWYRYISFCLETTPSLSCAEIISKIFLILVSLTRTYLLELNKQ